MDFIFVLINNLYKNLYLETSMAVNVRGRVYFRTPGIPTAPVAIDDSATVDFDDTVTISVLNNDTGDSISIDSFDDSSTQGIVTQAGNNLIYDPNGQFDGIPFNTSDTDSFSYTIIDSFGQTSNSANVTVTVLRGNPPMPVANDDSATTDWDSTVSIPVLSNDTGNSISIQSVDTTGTQGTATISGSNIVYDTSGQFDGAPFGTTDSDSFSYTIEDSANQTDSATVNITVNRQPAAAPVATDDTATVENDATVTIPVLNNDTGDTISIQSVDDSSTTGTVTQSGSNIVYDPNGQFNGLAEGSTDTDSFTYTIVDQFGQTSNAATVTVIVENPASVAFANLFDTEPQDGAPNALDFDPSGNTMFVLGREFDRIYEYNLSTAFDVTTASYTGNTFSPSGASGAFDFVFNPSGTRMFVVDGASTLGGTETVYQYDFTTGFDLSTGSFSGKSLTLTPQMPIPWGIAFNPTGTRMFVSGRDDAGIYQYNLTTGFDLGTASFSGNFFDTSPQIFSNIYDVEFGLNGMRMYVLDTPNGGTVFQYNLTTAYDITTASFSNKSFFESDNGLEQRGISISNDGTRLFTSNTTKSFESNPAGVYQYDITTPWELG